MTSQKQSTTLTFIELVFVIENDIVFYVLCLVVIFQMYCLLHMFPQSSLAFVYSPFLFV